MLKRIIYHIQFIAVLLSSMAGAAYAGDALERGVGAAQPKEGGKSIVPTSLTGTEGVFGTISNILIFITAAISVIVLIVGGLRYVLSTGDAGRVKAAKDTILYGIVGLVIAILAYAIINFVITALKPNP